MLSLVATLLLLAPPSETAENRQAQEALKEGQELMVEEKFEEAARAFRRAIQLDPLLTLAHHGLGRAYMALRQYPAAIAAFRGAREAFQQGAALGTNQRFDSDRARDDRIRYLSDKIRESQERLAAGNATQQRQRELLVQQWEMEISTLKREVGDPHELPPTPAFISVSLGSAYFRSNQMADAEREYRAALAVRPNLGEAHNNLAVVLLLTGRPADAREELRLAEKAGFNVPPGLKKDVDAAVAELPKKP